MWSSGSRGEALLWWKSQENKDPAVVAITVPWGVHKNKLPTLFTQCMDSFHKQCADGYDGLSIWGPLPLCTSVLIHEVVAGDVPLQVQQLPCRCPIALLKDAIEQSVDDKSETLIFLEYHLNVWQTWWHTWYSQTCSSTKCLSILLCRLRRIHTRLQALLGDHTLMCPVLQVCLTFDLIWGRGMTIFKKGPQLLCHLLAYISMSPAHVMVVVDVEVASLHTGSLYTVVH